MLYDAQLYKGSQAVWATGTDREKVKPTALNIQARPTWSISVTTASLNPSAFDFVCDSTLRIWCHDRTPLLPRRCDQASQVQPFLAAWPDK